MDKNMPVGQAMFEYLLGPSSEHGRAIKKATGLSDIDYCRLVYTFMLFFQTNQSAANFHMNKDVIADCLMSLKEYNAAWRKISKAGEVRAAGANREDPLWQQIRRIFNEQAREMFMSDDPDFNYTIAIDDDKVHFE